MTNTITRKTVSKSKKKQIQDAANALSAIERYGGFIHYFPDEDNLHATNRKRQFYARHKYKKSVEFFAKGSEYKRRALIAGNRTGKTITAGFEITCHLTGVYPDWWEGKKFTRPTQWWVVGQTTKTVKEILQPLLLGENGDFGSGMIPKIFLDLETMTDAKKVSTKISAFRVLHKPTGKYSLVEFKSCEEGAASFQGTERSIWIDEEAPLDVYNECNTRTLTTDDIVMLTFTPLNGLTELLQNFSNSVDAVFCEGDKGGSRYVVNQGMRDVPHLDEKEIVDLLNDTPVWLREAREKGIPTIGEGLVFSYPADKLFVEPFEIPSHWKRCAAQDFGWHPDPNALLWAAIDPQTEVVYLYHEFYERRTTPPEVVETIRSLNRGANMSIPLTCDPSGGGKSLKDGKPLLNDYADLGVFFQKPPSNSIDAGIIRISTLLRAGKLKAFNHLTNFSREYRNYKKKPSGKFQGDDHLIDCLRYIVLAGLAIAKSPLQYAAEQVKVESWKSQVDIFDLIEDGWMYR